MSNWTYIDDIEVTDKVNTIHCDTRDFHCSVREDKIDLRDARYPEITKVLHKDKYLIHQDEIKGFLKGLETITGGKAVDHSCRNHGECPWCTGNRTYNELRNKEKADYDEKEYKNQ